DYVLEGKGDDGQVGAKGVLDDCSRSPPDSRSSPGDDTDRSSAGTPELGASVEGHLDDCSSSPPDSQISSGDDTGRSSAGTPETSARVGSDDRFTRHAINIKEITVHGTVIHNLIVCHTNNHTA
ncbi:uncharacterized protein GLRG_11826, partial [Colletotrichum graminicola M1.001]